MMMSTMIFVEVISTDLAATTAYVGVDGFMMLISASKNIGLLFCAERRAELSACGAERDFPNSTFRLLFGYFSATFRLVLATFLLHFG